MFSYSLRARPHRLCALPGRVSVGIDLGRQEVRVVALRRIAGVTRVVGTARGALERDAPPAVLVASLREAVRSACRRDFWRPRRVVMAVPAGAVLLRTLTMDASA
jgi:Tfp pilus assembly PilM family ATPase